MDYKTVTSIVKPIIDHLNDRNQAIDLCVDEGMNRKLILSNTVYEDLNDEYDLRWCQEAADRIGLNGNINEVKDLVIRDGIRRIEMAAH